MSPVTIYVSEPEEASTKAVLYLTDVFGIQLPQNKLYAVPSLDTPPPSARQTLTLSRLADSFSRAGYITVAPDLFAGSPAPADLNEPGWSLDEFLAENNEEVVDARIATAVEYMKSELGIERFGVTGYCFGGRYAFRVGEAEAVFAAHPSNLLDEEISGAGVPASVAAAGRFSHSTLTPGVKGRTAFLRMAYLEVGNVDEPG